MAKPIPVNEAGLRRGRRFDAQTSPAWGFTRGAPPAPREVVSGDRLLFTWQALLLVSGLTGGLVVVSALGPWPELAATNLGLDEQGAFYLLVVGVYLLATTLYAVWRTRLLHDLNQAPWDARVMAYISLAVGGVVVLILGVAVLAMVAIIVALAWLGALVLSDAGGQPQD
jgi:hypothetical protein